MNDLWAIDNSTYDNVSTLRAELVGRGVKPASFITSNLTLRRGWHFSSHFLVGSDYS